MLRMVTGYWVTQIVGGAAYYSLVDHLEHQPMTARQLRVEALDEVATGRFLRGCVEPEIIKLEENRYFTTELLLSKERESTSASAFYRR